MSRAWQFDIYDSIRAVNWIRREVAKKRSVMEDKELVQALRAPFETSKRPSFLSDDEYLQPYLPEDALLPALSCESWNEDREGGGHAPFDGAHEASGAGLSAARSSTMAPGNDMAALRAENLLLREKLERQEALIEAVTPAALHSASSPLFPASVSHS